MIQRVKAEIYKLHELFQAWYNSSIEEVELNEISKRLAKDFTIVFPDASQHSKEDLVKMLEENYGNSSSFRIEIKNIEIKKLSKNCYLAKYEEWQFWNNSDEPKLRMQTTSVLEESGGTINWVSIHEMNSFQEELKMLKDRNKRVEIDKAWETSFARKALLAVLTYLVITSFFLAADLPKPFLNPIVPTLGYLLSTLTIPLAKKIWINYKR